MNRREFLINSGLALLGISLYPKLLFSEETRKDIYLTIDDGPRESMELILDSLCGENKATFFMIGNLLEKPKNYYESCKALELGHEIGNHSYSHPRFSEITIDKAKEEIEKTDCLIEKIYNETGVPRNKLFRFPYKDIGYSNHKGSKEKEKEIKSFLQEMGYSICFWIFDSGDFRYYSKKHAKSLMQILEEIKKTKESDIVLTHDSRITAEYIIPFYTSNYKLRKINKDVLPNS